MKVKEYLVNRILELEKDLENSKRNYDLLMKEVKAFSDKCDKLEDELDQYQIEREHIKQIITCNLDGDRDLYISHYENDNETLLAILDIKPEDYKEVIPDAETTD